MKIYDQSKSKILEKHECDLNKERFVDDFLVVGQRESNVEKVFNPDKFVTITQYDSCDIKEKILVYVPYTQIEIYKQELAKLETWFLTEYRETFEKCSRKIALQKLMKDGSTPQLKLLELYNQAEIYANRISKLRQIINIK